VCKKKARDEIKERGDAMSADEKKQRMEATKITPDQPRVDVAQLMRQTNNGVVEKPDWSDMSFHISCIKCFKKITSRSTRTLYFERAVWSNLTEADKANIHGLCDQAPHKMIPKAFVNAGECVPLSTVTDLQLP